MSLRLFFKAVGFGVGCIVVLMLASLFVMIGMVQLVNAAQYLGLLP